MRNTATQWHGPRLLMVVRLCSGRELNVFRCATEYHHEKIGEELTRKDFLIGE